MWPEVFFNSVIIQLFFNKLVDIKKLKELEIKIVKLKEEKKLESNVNMLNISVYLWWDTFFKIYVKFFFFNFLLNNENLW